MSFFLGRFRLGIIVAEGNTFEAAVSQFLLNAFHPAGISHVIQLQDTVFIDGNAVDLVGKAGGAQVLGFLAEMFSDGSDQLFPVCTSAIVVEFHFVNLR